MVGTVTNLEVMLGLKLTATVSSGCSCHVGIQAQCRYSL